MDTTAHRTIKQARDLIVDTFGLGMHLAGPRRHGINVEQSAALSDVEQLLWSLMANDPSPPECQTCATPLVQPATGRPRRFCSDTCRSKGRVQA